MELEIRIYDIFLNEEVLTANWEIGIDTGGFTLVDATHVNVEELLREKLGDRYPHIEFTDFDIETYGCDGSIVAMRNT